MSLLISTVLSGSRYRLAPLADAPWTMPGMPLRCSALTTQHVAAVSLGDDLVLQVLRRVLAAQVRLERAAQPRLLPPQPVANASQLRARIVDDLARRVDVGARPGDFALERRGVGARPCRRAGRRRRRGGWRSRVSSTESRNAASASNRGASSARPRRPARPGSRAVPDERAVRKAAVLRDVLGGLGGGRQQFRHHGVLGRGFERCQALRAHRGERKRAHCVDDAIEFERPKGGSMHNRNAPDVAIRAAEGNSNHIVRASV